jgi:hypothetical protein
MGAGDTQLGERFSLPSVVGTPDRAAAAADSAGDAQFELRSSRSRRAPRGDLTVPSSEMSALVPVFSTISRIALPPTVHYADLVGQHDLRAPPAETWAVKGAWRQGGQLRAAAVGRTTLRCFHATL